MVRHYQKPSTVSRYGDESDDEKNTARMELNVTQSEYEVYDVIVIGAGHNGLVSACYLAREGLKVLVLEGSERIGGAVHTAETIPETPGYRFDTCSVVHNLINISSIPEELGLHEVGLRYVETDPFSVSLFPDGRVVRFYRSVERTCEELARCSPKDADDYADFIRLAEPIAELSLSRLRASSDDRSLLGGAKERLSSVAKVLRRSKPNELAGFLAGPYGVLLEAHLPTEVGRMGIAPLAAHGTLGPNVPGTAFFACLQAAYHRYGNWHAVGGSGSLTQALTRRLEAWGGTVRTGAKVAEILVDGRVWGVRLETREGLEAENVVAAINPQTTLLNLVDETHIPRRLARRLRARHRSNAVQFVVHAALDRLPPWEGAPEDTWNGLQSVAGSLGQIHDNFVQAEAGLAPENPAVYVYTPSAIDESVAPAGGHTAYIACASYPSRFSDGRSWEERGEREAHRLLDTVEERAPGFKNTIQGLAWRHAEDWEREIGLLGGHPLHLDITLDQVGSFRPLPELSDHRSPIEGLYLSGAGTAPGGGVSGVPGRAAAKTLLSDRGA